MRPVDRVVQFAAEISALRTALAAAEQERLDLRHSLAQEIVGTLIARNFWAPADYVAHTSDVVTAVGLALDGQAAKLAAAEAKCEAISNAGHDPTCGGYDIDRCGCGWLQREGAAKYILSLEAALAAAEGKVAEMERQVERLGNVANARNEDNPAAQALDDLWKAIMLERRPDYGDWDYPGMAYRHMLAEFESMEKRNAELTVALRSIEYGIRLSRPTLLQLRDHTYPPQRVQFIENHVDVLEAIALHALDGKPHGLGDEHDYVVGLDKLAAARRTP